VTPLTGTGLAADDLYVLAHHDVTGRPFLQARALGIGLAGALLAELVLAGAIRVPDGRVALAGGARAGGRSPRWRPVRPTRAGPCGLRS
jgi:hypothetical protein